jgi:hypothetical protein
MKKTKVSIVLTFLSIAISFAVCFQGCPKSLKDLTNCGCDADLEKVEDAPNAIDLSIEQSKIEDGEK